MILNQVVQGPNSEKDGKEKNYSGSGLYAEGQAVGWDPGVPALSSLLSPRRGTLHSIASGSVNFWLLSAMFLSDSSSLGKEVSQGLWEHLVNIY